MTKGQANLLMEILETLGFCPKELEVKVPPSSTDNQPHPYSFSSPVY